MILKIEIPNQVMFCKDDEIVIRFTDFQTASCSIHTKRDLPSKMPTETSGKSPSDSTCSFLAFVGTLKHEFHQQGRHRLTETYASAARSFMNFRGNQDIPLQDISEKLIADYEVFLKRKGLTLNTVSFYMRIMRAIYNKAVGRNIIKDRKPFVHVFTQMTKTSKRAISLRILRKLAQAEIKNNTEKLARDLFLFSFYTRGMSFVDIVYLKKTDVNGSYLIYKRKKTGQELKVAWCKEMQELVDKHRSLDGTHLLGVLDSNSPKSLRKQYHYKQCLVNEALKRLADRLKLGVHLTMYVARHSWATIARQKHIPLSVICDGMGHNSEKTTQIYLKSVDAAIIDKSNARLIAAVNKKNEPPTASEQTDQTPQEDV